MTITNSRAALQAVEKSLSIQEGDSRASSIGKFFGGSLAKLTLAGLAGAEHGVSKAEDLIFKASQSRTSYIDEASQTFFRALKSLNTPFAPKTERIKAGWFGSKLVTIEGPTVSSYIRSGISRAKKGASDAKAFAAKHKTEIALGAALTVAFTATAVALYYFGPSLTENRLPNPFIDQRKAVEEITNNVPIVTQTQPILEAVNHSTLDQDSANLPFFGALATITAVLGIGGFRSCTKSQQISEYIEDDFSTDSGSNDEFFADLDSDGADVGFDRNHVYSGDQASASTAIADLTASQKRLIYLNYKQLINSNTNLDKVYKNIVKEYEKNGIDLSTNDVKRIIIQEARKASDHAIPTLTSPRQQETRKGKERALRVVLDSNDEGESVGTDISDRTEGNELSIIAQVIQESGLTRNSTYEDIQRVQTTLNKQGIQASVDTILEIIDPNVREHDTGASTSTSNSTDPVEIEIPEMPFGDLEL